MSRATAIGMVSESLRALLDGEMTLTPPVTVTILAPDEAGGNRRINLFLYKVQENPALKNLDWQVKQGEPTQLVPPPLSLNLFYLLTSYSPNQGQAGNAAAHEILGEAMRVFYENPIVPQDYLVDGLKNAKEQIKIVLNNLDMEELSQVWNTFTKPFRLSALYEVSVVQLDMLSDSERAMAKRVRKIGRPDVQAPFNPPVVESIEPVSGAVGTEITVSGENLSGWKAYVTVMRRLIVDGMDLTEDRFVMTLPGNLAPGFHEISVDISHLHRRTFFFEVTA
ncbi:MAG: Pvc16 family protein [Planctomycetota bacterium]